MAHTRLLRPTGVGVDNHAFPTENYSMLPTTHQRLNAEEFLQLPEGPPYFQLVNGEVFKSPSPNLYHQRISMNLSVLIGEYLRRNPVGECYAAPSDVKLDSKNVFEPDLYFVSKERRGIFSKFGVDGSPDLVIEILSPSTARLDLEHKKAVYARCGVRELWIIQPEERTIDVYDFPAGADNPTRELTEGETLTTPLLPGLELDTREVFRE